MGLDSVGSVPWADVNPHAIHSNLNLKMTGQLPVTRSEQASF